MCVGTLNFACLYVCRCFKLGALQKMFSQVGMFPGFNQYYAEDQMS